MPRSEVSATPLEQYARHLSETKRTSGPRRGRRCHRRLGSLWEPTRWPWIVRSMIYRWINVNHESTQEMCWNTLIIIEYHWSVWLIYDFPANIVIILHVQTTADCIPLCCQGTIWVRPLPWQSQYVDIDIDIEFAWIYCRVASKLKFKALDLWLNFEKQIRCNIAAKWWLRGFWWVRPKPSGPSLLLGPGQKWRRTKHDETLMFKFMHVWCKRTHDFQWIPMDPNGSVKSGTSLAPPLILSNKQQQRVSYTLGFCHSRPQPSVQRERWEHRTLSSSRGKRSLEPLNLKDLNGTCLKWQRMHRTWRKRACLKVNNCNWNCNWNCNRYETACHLQMSYQDGLWSGARVTNSTW